MTDQPEMRITAVAGYLLSVSLLQFLAVPLFMIGNDPATYDFISFEALFVAGTALAACSALLMLALHRGLVAWRKPGIANATLRFLFFWVLIAGFLLPVSVRAGMVDARTAGVDPVNLFATALIAAGLTWLCRTEAKRYVLVFAVVFSLYAVATSAIAIVQSGVWRPPATESTEAHESMRLSPQQNVLVISLDGLQGHIVAEVLADDPDLAATFRDFTLFENVMSQSPATEASIVGELFGVRDYKALGDSIDDVRAELADRGLVDEIPLIRVDDAYQRGYLFGKSTQIRQNDPAVTADSVEFLKYAIVRVATRYAVDNRISNAVFGILTGLVVHQGRDELAARLREHKGPDWDKRYIAEIFEFDSFVQDLTTGDKRSSFRYLHFGFTHYPVDFDRECTYRSDDRRWFRANQNAAGLAGESTCALAKLGEFLRKLEELGVYDNSFVVFKSDHGHPTNYFDAYPYNLEINEHSLWGYSRYRPVLMIKPARTRQDRLQRRPDLVLLGDLARTICRHADPAEPRPACDRFPGVDLLAPDGDDAGYFLYVVPTATSSFTFDAHISVPIESRRVDPVEALRASDGVRLSERNRSSN